MVVFVSFVERWDRNKGHKKHYALQLSIKDAFITVLSNGVIGVRGTNTRVQTHL